MTREDIDRERAAAVRRLRAAAGSLAYAPLNMTRAEIVALVDDELAEIERERRAAIERAETRTSLGVDPVDDPLAELERFAGLR